MNNKTKYDLKRILKSNTSFLILFVIISFIFFVGIQINYNKNHLERYSTDETHTVYQAVESIKTGKITNFRALEGSRWFVRAFYSGALIGMNSNMGGNVANDSWGYPGHNYVSAHYKNKSKSNPQEHPNMNDPNIRDFFYYLRLQNVLFSYISLLLLIIYAWKKRYLYALFFLSVLTGVNSYMLMEKSILYIENSYFAAMNFLIFLYFYLIHVKKITYFIVLFTSFFCAFIISIKFSCIFFILLLLGTIINREKESNIESQAKKAITFVISFLVFFRIINTYAFTDRGTMNTAIHQYFSNFWKYSTGTHLDQSFSSHFNGMLEVFVSSLGFLTYLLPIIFIIGFIYLKRSDQLKYGALVICLILTIVSILSQKEFIARNFVPFLGILLLLSGIFVQKVNDKTNKSKLLLSYDKKNIIMPILVFLAIISGILVNEGGMSKFKSNVFPSTEAGLLGQIQKIKGFKQKRVFVIDYPIKSIEKIKEINVFDLKSYPIVGSNNFKKVNDSLTRLFTSEDIVLINRVKNNKQYTNYLLPKLYNKNRQYGNYFVFYNEP